VTELVGLLTEVRKLLKGEIQKGRCAASGPLILSVLLSPLGRGSLSLIRQWRLSHSRLHLQPYRNSVLGDHIFQPVLILAS